MRGHERIIRTAVVLAAGRGTRLGSLTQGRPKALLPIVGKPIAVRAIERLGGAGVQRVIVVAGDWDEGAEHGIREVLAEDIELVFIRQVNATGTVDALQLAAPFLKGSFYLTAVDTITSTAHLRRLAERMHKHPHALATLSLLPASAEYIRQSAAVRLDGERVTMIQEKPDEPFGRHAAVMVYAFSDRFLAYLDSVYPSVRGEREIASAIAAGIHDGEWVSHVTLTRRHHLTRPHDLLQINLDYLKLMGPVVRLEAEDWSGEWAAPVYVADGAMVGRGAQLGPAVYLEAGAEVGGNASVSHAVVLAGGRVAAGETCTNMLIGDGIRVADH